MQFSGVRRVLGRNGRDLATNAALITPLSIGVTKVQQQVFPRP